MRTRERRRLETAVNKIRTKYNPKKGIAVLNGNGITYKKLPKNGPSLIEKWSETLFTTTLIYFLLGSCTFFLFQSRTA